MSKPKLYDIRVNLSMTKTLWIALGYYAAKKGMKRQEFIRAALWAQCDCVEPGRIAGGTLEGEGETDRQD